MKKFCFLTLLFSCTLFFTECKKSEVEKPTEPDISITRPLGRFVVSPYVTLDMPVMYTQNSIITDTQYIKEFLQRDTVISPFPDPHPAMIDSFFIFNQTTQFDDKIGIELNFGNTDSVKIPFIASYGFNLQPNPCAKIFAPVNNNEVVLRDTGISTLSSFFLSTVERIVQVRYKLEKNNPDWIESWFYQHPYISGKYNYTLLHSNDTFYIPLMRYRISLRSTTGDGFRAIISEGNKWIYFNPDIRRYLGGVDTIIVQNKRAMLIR